MDTTISLLNQAHQTLSHPRRFIQQKIKRFIFVFLVWLCHLVFALAIILYDVWVNEDSTQDLIILNSHRQVSECVKCLVDQCYHDTHHSFVAVLLSTATAPILWYDFPEKRKHWERLLRKRKDAISLLCFVQPTTNRLITLLILTMKEEDGMIAITGQKTITHTYFIHLAPHPSDGTAVTHYPGCKQQSRDK